MQAWKLIREYEKRHPYGHFFDRETLKFFGERESEMRVLKRTVRLDGYDGEFYVLSRVQHRHPAGPTRVYTYFNVDTFDPITS